MGKIVLSCFVLTCFILSGCSPKPEDLLIDSFEGDINNTTVDYGASQGSSMKASASVDSKVCGEQSLKMEYELKSSGYMWAARGYGLDVKGAARWVVEPKDIKWSGFNALSLQMYGANSNCVVALDIKDAGGEMWRFLLDDDFTGWKKFICPFADFFVRKDWQPDAATKNEILDFPIMSFQFEPRLPGKGVFYFDCVELIYVTQKKKE